MQEKTALQTDCQIIPEMTKAKGRCMVFGFWFVSDFFLAELAGGKEAAHASVHPRCIEGCALLHIIPADALQAHQRNRHQLG